MNQKTQLANAMMKRGPVQMNGTIFRNQAEVWNYLYSQGWNDNRINTHMRTNPKFWNRVFRLPEAPPRFTIPNSNSNTQWI